LEEHILSLKKVFPKLRDAHLKLQLDKCKFMKIETELLGHIVTTTGIKPNPKKNKCHYKFPDTENAKRNKIISRIM